MSKRGLLGALLGAALAFGCAHAPKAKEADDMRQLVYVDHVKAPAAVAPGKSLVLVVEGNLPSPAWQLDDVVVDKTDHKLTIGVWGRIAETGAAAAQVLVPFSKSVEVKGLTGGQWTIEVKGHGGTSETVTVKVAD